MAELRRLGYEPTYDESVFETSMFTAGLCRGPSDGVQAGLGRSLDFGAHRRARWLRQRAAAAAIRGMAAAATPKIFIGYSDNTSLLSWLTCQCGITAIHGPMIDGRLAKGPAGTTQPRSWH